jgi:hypothetical protein
VTQTFQDETLFGISNFGHCDLFDICDLIFVIFELPTNQIPSVDNQSLVLWARILYCFPKIGGEIQAIRHGGWSLTHRSPITTANPRPVCRTSPVSRTVTGNILLSNHYSFTFNYLN